VNVPIEEAENIALNQVKFINFILEECRKRNKELEEKFGPTYGKFVGIGTVYEDVICAMRKVKKELDDFLGIIRENLKGDYDQRLKKEGRRERQKF